MSLVWKPHEIEHWQIVPEVVEGRVIRSEWELNQSFFGLIVAETPKEIKDMIDLDCKSPAIVLLEVEDSFEVKIGDHLELNEIRYQVVADPVRFEMGLPTDHAKVVVERLDQ